jgi:D-amino-acid oxidase
MSIEKRIIDQTPEKYQGITEKQPPKIAIIGAGVIGLSTALLAQEAGYDVAIYSDRQPTETTSAKAAASFKPHAVAYNELAHRTVEIGWDDFARIAHEQNPTETGVRKHVHWEAASAQKADAPYLVLMEDLEHHEKPNVPGGYSFGWKYKTFFVDTSLYLPWMTHKFEAQNGRMILVANKFEHPEQFRDIPADVVFNCTGLGARELMNDDKMQPIKGQIALIDPRPDMDWSISADGFYVYPRSKDTVLGGSTEPGVENEDVDKATVHVIVKGNQRILPDLTEEAVRGSYAGLRPYREGSIRIEAEERDNQKIIHNYGHGGSGITMSWGSARLALNRI